MNCIFDIGNVLINFHPMDYLNTIFADRESPETIGLLFSAIFAAPEWAQMDQGTLTHAQATEIFCQRQPAHKELIQETMARLREMLTPIQETVDLLPKIKAQGQKLYFLSNYHKELSAYIIEQNPFFKEFEGGVFSCDIHINKPAPGIYEHLLQTYALKASDCLFIDDLQENVTAAEGVGMRGFVFAKANDLAQRIFQ